METNDVKKLIADLMEMMKDSQLSELEVEVEGARVRLSRQGSGPVQTVMAMPAPTMTVQGVGGSSMAGAAPAAGPAEKAGKKIAAPMVGTFYQAPSPEADAYVEVGDVVEEDTVVCIIEAMKVMNEIKAERKGRILEVLAENGEAVEFGKRLFRIG